MGAIYSHEELELMQDITQISLTNGASAFAQMVRDEILVKQVEHDMGGAHLKSGEQLADETMISVLHTDVIGDITASSYLAISEENVHRICEKLLPSSERGLSEMQEAILLEIDNIIIAALVTKYSNLFRKNMHGHVPQMQQTSVAAFEEQLQATEATYSFRVQLKGFKSSINMWMYCFFNESLSEPLQNFDVSDSYVGQEDQSKEEEKGAMSFFKKMFNWS